MPGFDGTGPLGRGPTGFRRGPCSRRNTSQPSSSLPGGGSYYGRRLARLGRGNGMGGGYAGRRAAGRGRGLGRAQRRWF